MNAFVIPWRARQYGHRMPGGRNRESRGSRESLQPHFLEKHSFSEFWFFNIVPAADGQNIPDFPDIPGFRCRTSSSAVRQEGAWLSLFVPGS
jgi:hypothetical protein